MKFVRLVSEWDLAKIANSVAEKLARFCFKLGGKIEDMPLPSQFACDVDPVAVIEHFSEFKKLAKMLSESNEITVAYFGRNDAYFTIFANEAMAGFTLSKEFTPIGDAIEDLATDVEYEWYKHMEKHGIEPEFHFIPDFRYGTSGDATHQFIDLEARTTYTEIDLLKDIARAMLKFKEKLEEKIRKAGAIEIKEYR